jgi:hypothetical protein
VKQVLEEMQLNIANEGLKATINFSNTALMENLLRTYWCALCGEARDKEGARCNHTRYYWVTLNVRDVRVIEGEGTIEPANSHISGEKFLDGGFVDTSERSTAKDGRERKTRRMGFRQV